jgi:hypothetical protein
MILHEIFYPFKYVVRKSKTNKLMIFALFHSPFMVITFLKFWICTLKSNPNTYIGYGNTFLVDEGPIEVVGKTTILLGDKY